jgi:hypothetical protein
MGNRPAHWLGGLLACCAALGGCQSVGPSPGQTAHVPGPAKEVYTQWSGWESQFSEANAQTEQPRGHVAARAPATLTQAAPAPTSYPVAAGPMPVQLAGALGSGGGPLPVVTGTATTDAHGMLTITVPAFQVVVPTVPNPALIALANPGPVVVATPYTDLTSPGSGAVPCTDLTPPLRPDQLDLQPIGSGKIQGAAARSVDPMMPVPKARILSVKTTDDEPASGFSPPLERPGSALDPRSRGG